MTQERIDLEALLELLSNSAVNLPELDKDTPRPRYATIRVIDLRGSSDKVSLEFVGATYSVDLTEYEGGIRGLVKYLAITPVIHPDDPSPKPPFDCPLSLNNKEYCYVVLVLRGNAKNWQFASEREPFAIGLEGLKANAYFEARRVDEEGNIVDPKVKMSGCRIAYFIANGPKALKDKDEYRHAFNIHVDLKYKDSKKQPSVMPITIDPDVRFPGGSGP